MTAVHYETFLGGRSCVGGGAQGAARVSSQWQIVAEISGCLIVNMPTSQSGDSLVYAVGPRWAPRANRQISLYSQLLVGGRKATHEIMDSQLRTKLQSEWEAGKLPHYPMRSDYSVETASNGFAILAGGGVDININPVITIRAASLEYTRSLLPPVDRIDAAQGVRFAYGLVLRLGTW